MIPKEITEKARKILEELDKANGQENHREQL